MGSNRHRAVAIGRRILARPTTSGIVEMLVVRRALWAWGIPELANDIVPRMTALVNAAVQMVPDHVWLEVQLVRLTDSFVLEVIFTADPPAGGSDLSQQGWWWHRWDTGAWALRDRVHRHRPGADYERVI